MSAPTTISAPARPVDVAVRPIDVAATLGAFRHGRSDPTTRLERTAGVRGSGGGGTFVRATTTPDGPGVLTLRWGADVTRPEQLDAHGEGPGGNWLLGRVAAMTGFDDVVDHRLEDSDEPAVAAAARRSRGWRIGASGTLYHEVLPTILEQRITSIEAHRQWRRLCTELGDPAPGGPPGLLLPPAPDRLARRPAWWFHPLGVERRRADTLTRVARHADAMWAWTEGGPDTVRLRLGSLPGIGVWTLGTVLAPTCGDADALAVGDYHLKNVVAWAMRGEARATDDRMLELLAPFAGQRGRVASLLARAVGGAPKFGPRQRILPMHRW